ncbi:polyphenol oxidase a1 chloroplastic [Phtheirospermum japonicum]|uniref:Polyphenol oxidase a1 chloroplastic n=1 Tax=Phtheirospermum japonicum TaxID=374723 RepID=A0A830BJL4_9LAMI|nr:polyphenol oxidase a1 chloroplastic [Phtheirospermum japonicum]
MFPAIAPTNCSFASPFFPTTSLPSTKKNLNHPSNLACKSKPSNEDEYTPKPNPNDEQTPEPRLDRRSFLLLGFGSSGIYNNAISNLRKLSPDFLNCVDAVKPFGDLINCCNPTPPGTKITDFAPPAASASAARVRTAAHSDDGAVNMAKYKKAVELMRKLPADDPRNFTRQANVHCAYCNGAYNQVGFPDRKFEIHQSWLFFPFHRWYIYFFERICAKLLGDDTFALPFWNWDSPSGMEIPALFNASDSSLYDPLRDQSHLPPVVVDLNYGGFLMGFSPEQQRSYNLNLMYKQMISNAATPRLFMGQPFKSGDDITKMLGAGSVEIAPHNTMHVWAGDERETFRENMGIFYSAARDPIFYAHHANVDRLWDIWVTKLRGKFFTDPDWLETSYVFYDEEKKAVRVKTKDCLDLSRLGYTYKEVENPWLDAKPHPRRLKGENRLPYNAREVTQVFPKTLDGALNVVVKCPRRWRRGKEKEEEEMVLVIEGIAYDSSQQVKFDVYVNEDDVELCTLANTEMLGSFVSVPHGRHDSGMMTEARCSQRFGLSGVLLELGAEEDDLLLVTLVPRRGSITVGGVKIEFEMIN